jgi:hypothetical protein
MEPGRNLHIIFHWSEGCEDEMKSKINRIGYKVGEDSVKESNIPRNRQRAPSGIEMNKGWN